MTQETATVPIVIKGDGKQFIGTRDEQEDYFLLIPSDLPEPAEDALAILADGMGAHSDGAQASQRIANAFVGALTQTRPENLPEALAEANASLAASKKAGYIDSDAGATLIALLLKDGRCSWISVGDSLLYLFRDGRLQELNEKHIWKHQLKKQVAQGKITQNEANAFPDPQALYSAVTGEEIADVDFRPCAFEFRDGDRYILATDGLATILPELEEFLNLPAVKTMSPAELNASLLEQVERAHIPNQDNTTIIVLDVCHQQTLPQSSPEHEVHAAQISLLGDRNSQQDACGVWQTKQSIFAVVADGAGGHAGGALASATAVATMQRLWERTLIHGCSTRRAAKLIQTAILEAHDEIIRVTGDGNARRSGKSAIVALYISGGKYAVIHIGDCRLYQRVNSDWMLRTKDDSVLQVLIDAGRVSKKEAASHPDQSRLLQMLGGIDTPEPHIRIGTYSAKDSFLLCCDGFWNQLPAPMWKSSLWYASAHNRQNKLSKLAQKAIRAKSGDSDNVTAIWIAPKKGIGIFSSPTFHCICCLVLILLMLLGLCGYIIANQLPIKGDSATTAAFPPSKKITGTPSKEKRKKKSVTVPHPSEQLPPNITPQQTPRSPQTIDTPPLPIPSHPGTVMPSALPGELPKSSSSELSPAQHHEQ